MIAEDMPIPYPPLDSCGYILDYLYEVGPAPKGEELMHEEIAHWQRNIGLSLEPWETRFIKALSRVHLAQSQMATDPACPAPFGGFERPKNLNKLIDAVFG